MPSIKFQQMKNLFFLMLFAFAITLPSCKESSTDNDIVATADDGTGIPPLFKREGELAKNIEWKNIQDKVATLRKKISMNSNDIQSRLQMATIYIAEARITGNANYYQSIFIILDQVLEIDPNNFEAKVYKASVKMSQHQFAQAKELAEQAKNINPNNAYVYGVLVDANVELGNYNEAIAMSDKMQQLKPSLEAYSRASYLREIYGDYAGAIQAMTMAVQAGAPGLETTEWARVQLGDLYLNTGKLNEAANIYKMSLQYRPDYPMAEMGLAKIERAKKNYPVAITHTEQAIRTVSEAAFVSFLADLQELNGEKDKAMNTRKQIVSLTEDAEKEQPKNQMLRHNGSRELAIAYMNNKQLDKALQYAIIDWNMRPENIDANELVAWIYYLDGNYVQAKPYVEKMLATNTKNANTLIKASMIFAKIGDRQRSEKLKLEALATNAIIDQRIILANK